MPSPDMDLTGHEQPRHVFVYGTLRRDEQRDINRLLPAPLWVGHGSIHGLLYDMGSYPGLVVAAGEGAGRIRGEVYAITPGLERLLDEIEEVWPQQTGEYGKLEVDVTLEAVDGPGQAPLASRTVRCLVYEIHGSRVEGKARIAGGDWVLHRLGRPA